VLIGFNDSKMEKLEFNRRMKHINEITTKNPKQWYNHQWSIWNIKHREKKPIFIQYNIVDQNQGFKYKSL
jgi:hypothetical protein